MPKNHDIGQLLIIGFDGTKLSSSLRSLLTRGAEPKDEPYPGPYYVVFNASGGWDTTYLMDPKGVNDTIDLAFSLASPTEGRLEVLQNGAVVATPLPQSPLDAGGHALDWNGAWDGRYLPDGSYLAIVTIRGGRVAVSTERPSLLDFEGFIKNSSGDVVAEIARARKRRGRV